MSIAKLLASLHAHRIKIAAALAVILFGLAWFFSSDLGGFVAKPTDPISQAKNATSPQAMTLGADPSNPLAGLSREQQRQLLQERLTLAEQTLNSYRASTVYPPQSRPIKEHPDQIYPNQAIDNEQPLRKTDGSFAPDIRIKTTQSHVFIGSREKAVFSIAAFNKEGQPLPIQVQSAVAKGIVPVGQRNSAQWTMTFADDGRLPDTQANDGVFTAEITPSLTGLSEFSGTIRSQVTFNVGDKTAFASFDIVYTPSLPASWSGGVRDGLESGSLVFYLRSNIYQAGRYLISGRLDDANGKPFALLSFNDELTAGPQEIKLLVFGKLLHDYAPAFPLTLRDVDGYLLKIGSDPDRAMMARLIGPVHASKKYALSSFSTAEATSEQRSRYLLELNADVERAKAALDALQTP